MPNTHPLVRYELDCSAYPHSLQGIFHHCTLDPKKKKKTQRQLIPYHHLTLTLRKPHTNGEIQVLRSRGRPLHGHLRLMGRMQATGLWLPECSLQGVHNHHGSANLSFVPHPRQGDRQLANRGCQPSTNRKPTNARHHTQALQTPAGRSPQSNSSTITGRASPRSRSDTATLTHMPAITKDIAGSNEACEYLERKTGKCAGHMLR